MAPVAGCYKSGSSPVVAARAAAYGPEDRASGIHSVELESDVAIPRRYSARWAPILMPVPDDRLDHVLEPHTVEGSSLDTRQTNGRPRRINELADFNEELYDGLWPLRRQGR